MTATTTDPELTNEELGRRLKLLRTWADMTLRELSAATGIPVSNLSRYELGRRCPSLLHLQLIVAAVGSDLVTLLSSPGDSRAFPNVQVQIPA